MAQKDWMPSTREAVLQMAMKWNNQLAMKGTAWNVPTDTATELNTLTLSAQAAYNEANTKDRTKVLTAKMNTAFKALTAAMRDIKKRYFYIPPLTEIDMAALDLNPPDTIPTPIGPPQTPVTVIVSYSGKNMLHLNIVPITGYNYDDRADYGFRIYYGIMPPGGATPEQAMEKQYLLREPQTPEELNKSFFTRRKKDIMDTEKLPYETSGMACYISARYENSKGDHGPWGSVVTAIIP